MELGKGWGGVGVKVVSGAAEAAAAHGSRSSSAKGRTASRGAAAASDCGINDHRRWQSLPGQCVRGEGWAWQTVARAAVQSGAQPASSPCDDPQLAMQLALCCAALAVQGLWAGCGWGTGFQGPGNSRV